MDSTGFLPHRHAQAARIAEHGPAPDPVDEPLKVSLECYFSAHSQEACCKNMSWGTDTRTGGQEEASGTAGRGGQAK